MVGANDPEVSFIERRDHGLVEAICGGDGGYVDYVKVGISVDGDEFVDSGPVRGGEIDDIDVAGQDGADEPPLGDGAVTVQ